MLNQFNPKQASDYSTEEKIKFFNECHQFALDAFDYLMANQREMKDVEYYSYEMVMDLLGKGVWDAINEIL